MKWKPWLIRLAFGVTALLTLGALALAIENYRGKRAWESCRAALEAQGEELDWLELIPPPVAPGDNALATPLLAPCIDYVLEPATQTARVRDTNACAQLSDRFAWAGPLSGSSWTEGTLADLDAWQAAVRHLKTAAEPGLRALFERPKGTPMEDLRFLLEADRPALDELRAATRRPSAGFNLSYDDGFSLLLPQLSLIKRLTLALRVAAIAELIEGQSEAAGADTLAMLALSEAVAREPVLIAALVRMALMESALGPVWEGLARRKWPEPQLQALETRLAQVNGVAEVRRALTGERAFALAALGALPLNPTPGPAAGVSPMSQMMSRLPAAMIYQNQVNIARLYQERLLAVFDADAGRLRMEPIADEQVYTRQLGEASLRRHPYRVFAALLLPAVGHAPLKAARYQANLSLARVAIALERHRLAVGAYPDQLEALVPRFLAKLPPDPVTGEQLRYRRDPADQFLLYSVGLNQKDDGGQGTPRRSRTASGPPVPAGDDWVWRSTAR